MSADNVCTVAIYWAENLVVSVTYTSAIDRWNQWIIEKNRALKKTQKETNNYLNSKINLENDKQWSSHMFR